MDFNNFIKNEFKRLFENIAYKMEAEKLFIDGIKEDKFFYIESFNDGIECNLFNKEIGIDSHVSMFKTEKINRYIDDVYFYNINVVLQKNGSKFNLLFLGKKPIVKKINDKSKDSKDDIMENLTDPNKLIDTLTNPGKLLSSFTSMFGGKLYKIEYSDLVGGKDFTESELDKINRRDRRRSKFLRTYKLNKMNKDADISSDESSNYKKKRIGNKFSKKEVEDIVGNKCKKFNNMYEDINILMLNIYDIPEIDLVENIFHCYYLILFNYILPNLYNNFKNINKVEKIDIEFESLINSNKILNESMKSVFFFAKNNDLYNKIINTNSYLHMLPYELGNIEIIISKAPIEYN
jgi:hypothetical protein